MFFSTRPIWLFPAPGFHFHLQTGRVNQAGMPWSSGWNKHLLQERALRARIARDLEYSRTRCAPTAAVSICLVNVGTPVSCLCRHASFPRRRDKAVWNGPGRPKVGMHGHIAQSSPLYSATFSGNERESKLFYIYNINIQNPCIRTGTGYNHSTLYG